MNTTQQTQEQKDGRDPALREATGSVPAIPLTTIEAVWHLSNGNPIEIPTPSFAHVIQRIEAYFSETSIDVAVRGIRTTITPIGCKLSNEGRRMLSQNTPVCHAETQAQPKQPAP